jgi:putative flippase GtrA
MLQFVLYLFVGGLSFVVDIGVFVALQNAGLAVIPASVMSFIAATIANYLLCIVFAFQRGRLRRDVETLCFLAVVLTGLALNTGLVWLFVYKLSVVPTAAKVLAVPIVLIWNYLGRRVLVFGRTIPPPVRAWLRRPGSPVARVLGVGRSRQVPEASGILTVPLALRRGKVLAPRPASLLRNETLQTQEVLDE